MWSFGSPCGEAGPSLPHSEAALGWGPPGGVPVVGGSPVASSYHHTWCPALPHRSRTGVVDVEWEAGSTWGPLRGDRKPRACLCSPRCPCDALSPEQRVRTLGAVMHLLMRLSARMCPCLSLLSQTLEGLSCHDVQGSQPGVKGEPESHLGSADMEHVPDHGEVGREAGALT